jgi:hypothetical protein
MWRYESHIGQSLYVPNKSFELSRYIEIHGIPRNRRTLIIPLLKTLRSLFLSFVTQPPQLIPSFIFLFILSITWEVLPQLLVLFNEV